MLTLLDLALLDLLLLNLLLLLTIDLTLLHLLLLNLLLLLAIDVANLLLLLAFNLTLLILLLLNLLLLLAIHITDLLILLTLDTALLVPLLLNLLLLLTSLVLLLLRRIRLAAAIHVAGRFVPGQRLATDAETQKADTRQMPDARFHAFLTGMPMYAMDRDKTAILMRRSPHAISTLLTANIILTQRKRGPRGPLWEFRPGSTLVASAHLMPSSGQYAARGPGNPLGLEAAAGLIRRAALDAMSGQ